MCRKIEKLKCCILFTVVATDLALGCRCPLQFLQLHHFHPLDRGAGRSCVF